MRLPKDHENWTAWHVDKALAAAWRAFDNYEKKVNFKWPKEKIDDLYRPYMHASEEAIAVARTLNYRLKEAEALP